MTDDNDDPTTDEMNHNLNESADKMRLATKLTRGTGTRDQEAHTLKARGETPAEAAEAMSELVAELAERDVFERARNIQPEVSDEGGDAE